MSVKRKSALSLIARQFHILIIAIFLIGLLPLPALAADGTVTGQVTDNATGDPIENADVLFYESGVQDYFWTESTDNVGQYSAAIPEGTGYEIGGMGIIKGAKHPDAAKKWFDWALSPEAQALGPKYKSYQAPTVKGVELSHPELLEVNLIDYNFNWAAEHKTEFVNKFINEIATADNLRK